VITIVGSKGKGTAATYASAYLASAGLRIVTVTSPALRDVRDRIRCDGRAISADELSRLAEPLAAARSRLPRYRPGGGYLSPSGLFIIAGVHYARQRQADAIVLEAGMGGASDEVSLFPPIAVGMTRIFDEHIGVIGDTTADIARDKAAVVTAATVSLISAAQDGPVAAAITETAQTRSSGGLLAEFIQPGDSEVPVSLLPPAFGRVNAEVGCLTASRALGAIGRSEPDGAPLSAVLSSVVLPGRYSFHRVPGTSVEIFADAAINRPGVAAALVQAYQRWDAIDQVLVCFPDHKDVDGAIAELAGLPATSVHLTGKPRLTFTHQVPDAWNVTDIDHVDREFLVAHGPRIAAIGTGYFIARMLNLAEADTERLFTPLSRQS
jgi:dihydrofolate synthase / folylpolyglutamate synthase